MALDGSFLWSLVNGSKVESSLPVSKCGFKGTDQCRVFSSFFVGFISALWVPFLLIYCSTVGSCEQEARRPDCQKLGGG